MMTTANTDRKIEIMRGPKLDASMRPMWFTIRNGKKRRIGESSAIQMIRNGRAVEVEALSEGTGRGA